MGTKTASEIRIRDPFVVPDKAAGKYYLFGTTDTDPWNGPGEGFLVYESEDLQNWSEPRYAFRAHPEFWATTQFWAPEVHFYRDSWYMLASFKSEDRCRGVQILKSDRITGPYVPVSDYPVTPADWECLDGTLFVDETSGKPWLVFSHEWVQINNGTICCAELSADLREMVSKPITLFSAKDAPWCVPVNYSGREKGKDYVTDGPFLYRAGDGSLKMIWSSFSENGYCIGLVESLSGTVEGPWVHREKPILEIGGHGMVFDDLAGNTFLALHSPNVDKLERPILVPYQK